MGRSGPPIACVADLDAVTLRRLAEKHDERLGQLLRGAGCQPANHHRQVSDVPPNSPLPSGGEGPGVG
jgi:hypothetical protein